MESQIRQPIQILVLPFRKSTAGNFEFLLLQRADNSIWQGVSGGVENNETTKETARREAFEELGIPINFNFIQLDMRSSLPRSLIKMSESSHWDTNLLIIPEHYFAVDVTDFEIKLSSEHKSSRWCCYTEAHKLLTFDTNKIGLWELNERLTTGHCYS